MVRINYGATFMNPDEEEKTIHVTVTGDGHEDSFHEAIDKAVAEIDKLKDSWEWVLYRIEMEGVEIR